MESKEIVQQNTTPELIRQALANNADLEKLEKLLTIHERWEANEAKKAYHKAMAAFKANPPDIEKDKKVAFDTGKGRVAYNHATLANVTEKINSALSKYGLSSGWKINQINGTIAVTCKITHDQGYSEETTITAPADQTGLKNAIQSIGSTITYLQRYSLLSLTGLATHEMDDDGKSEETISSEEVDKLSIGITEAQINLDLFLKYMGVDSLNMIAKVNLKKATDAIEIAKAKRAKKA